ncbi:MAG: SseB family protein [Blautia sp.]|nr:SseB family protein [Blautia sp.]
MMDKKKLKSVMLEKKGEAPTDPKLTLDVKNPEVEAQMRAYSTEKTEESLSLLITKLREARLLVPAALNGKKQPVPCVLKAPTGEMLFPVYTSKEQIPAEPKSPVIINMPFLAVNRMVARPGANATGIVINPFTNNLVFREPLVKRIEEVESRRQKGRGKTVELTPEQYTAFERRQFETKFLPRRLFENGKELFETLCEKKEACIDELFEESYQQKRMYPYLPEDFSVMVMHISGELQLVRVDMPGKIEPGACHRVYLAWNEALGSGRYFTVEQAKEKGVKLLGEIGGDGKAVSHGESPVEGAELQRIIDIIKGESAL